MNILKHKYIIIGYLRKEVRKNERNNKFHYFTDSNLVMSNPMIKETGPKTLSQIRGPEIFDDPEALKDSGSDSQHVRVKRITNLFNSPPEVMDIPSNENSPLPYSVLYFFLYL
jgi:hypothetical protein